LLRPFSAEKAGTLSALFTGLCTFLNQGVCMLTATYATIAIAAEQDKTRSMLSRLQQYVETAWKSLHNLDLAFLDTVFGKLTQFDRFCRMRKTELYLIPTLRGMSREAESLVGELDLISGKAASALRVTGEQLNMVIELGKGKVAEICHSMQLYCRHIAMRLEREETELMPLARRILSVEQWFSIAAQLLSEESRGSGRRHHWGEGSQASFNGSRNHRSSVNLH